jgi:hypothetical protein
MSDEFLDISRPFIFSFSSLPVLAAGFKPSILGFCVKCSTTELLTTGHSFSNLSNYKLGCRCSGERNKLSVHDLLIFFKIQFYLLNDHVSTALVGPQISRGCIFSYIDPSMNKL